MLKFAVNIILFSSMVAAAEPTAPAPNEDKPFIAALFSEHMVMQRDQRLPIWGWTSPGAEVRVTLAGHPTTAQADTDGKWLAWLPALPAGGPHILQINGPQQATINDILIGDVWLCAGQSNMEMSLHQTANGQAVAAVGANRRLRHFVVEKRTSATPLATCNGTWTVANPQTVGLWSAVGYHFARELETNLDVPIGLINASWGGTRVEAWTSRQALSAVSEGTTELAQLDAFAVTADEANRASVLTRDAWNAGKATLFSVEKDFARQQQFAAPAYDDHDWVDIKAPATWDSQGFNGLRGEGWYRKVVDIPAAWAGKDLELSPGAADEIETTFFNGVKVGSTGSLIPFDVAAWNVQRQYSVPGKFVTAGKTVIAIRVLNLVYEGGLRSNDDPAFMYLRLAGGTAQDSIPLAGQWRFAMPISMKEPQLGNPNIACVLHNAMIRPLMPFPITGAILYQGESNAGNAFAYRERFPAMINDWRASWGIGDFPFLWVQLAAFQNPHEQPQADNWAVLREAQNYALQLPRTGTAIAIDVGDAADIHPKDKQTVGHRLALVARAVAYQQNIVHSGPRYQALTITGSEARISFATPADGLVAKGGELSRFALSGADRIFHWATARIDGDTVVVTSPLVPAPVAVRYAFEIHPAGANLTNRDGLPASPFRTDDWPVPTQP